MNDFKKSVLQGEILVLLHDIGKLTWKFIERATFGKSSKGFDENDVKKIHTLYFLSGINITSYNSEEFKKAFKKNKDGFFPFYEKAICGIHKGLDLQEVNQEYPWYKENPGELQKLLLKPIKWMNIREEQADGKETIHCMTALGSLLGLHHRCSNPNIVASLSEGDNDPWGMILSMYADTADSFFTKSAGSKDELRQGKGIYLASPLGGVEKSLDKDLIESDEKKFFRDLEIWASSFFASAESSDPDIETLVQKRNQLREILEKHTRCHLAETRLPNNDVSLWQHSTSVASIFKALFSGYLLSQKWENRLHNEELAYWKQHVALFSVRWDEDRWLARSFRSYDIVGRQGALSDLCDAIKKAIEDDLCIGNEVYRDHNGISFLIADLTGDVEELNDAQSAMRESLLNTVHEYCTGSVFQGELAWKVVMRSSPLRLTDMFRDLNTPYEEISGIPIPHEALWQSEWKKGETKKQICPRCGLRPMAFSDSHTGGEDRQALCEVCSSIRTLGGRNFRKYDQRVFGVSASYDLDKMNQEMQKGEGKNNRLALVQGLLPLNNVFNGSVFDSLLTHPRFFDKECTDFNKYREKIANDLKRVKAEDCERENLSIFSTIFWNKKWDGSKDGWCSDAEEGHYQRRWIENLILDGGSIDALGEEELVRRVLLWSLQKHPAPSRLARIWETCSRFMRSVFQIAETMKRAGAFMPFIPLTCDATRFQILVPADMALCFMEKVSQAYGKSFGRVRHLFPFHISASIFYHKAPLYIAMDAARRFRRRIYGDSTEKALWSETWTLLEDPREYEGGKILVWETGRKHHVEWKIPCRLPGDKDDSFYTWFTRHGSSLPVSLFELKKGDRCEIHPSSFDFEVLDASTRRYDIRYLADGHRAHFMMPRVKSGPRPHYLEDIEEWQRSFAPIFADKETNGQRKTALELVARVHNDWNAGETEEVFRAMICDILENTLKCGRNENIVQAAMDGTFFDLFEWYDFIESIREG